MSADNWGICPKCAKPELPAYGTVSEAEYLAAREVKATPLRTLREDYEVFTDEQGVFTVNYRCSCATCRFEFKYKHSQQV
jgi:hypothetical protein